MRNSLAIAWFGAIAAATLLTCSSGSAEVTYLTEIESWKLDRVERLKGPSGFLNLVGLFWLRSDVSTMGSSPDRDFVLPDHAAPMVGSLRKEAGTVLMAVEDGVVVYHNDMPVESIVMDNDQSERPVVLTHGSLAWTVIRRDDKFAVRVRDFENPAIAAFKPIEYFPVDASFRVPARLERYDEPRQMRVDTVIAGLDYRPQSPGKLVFDIGGVTFRLEAYDSGNRLFLVFGDLTSGRETYPAGRFLYTAKPDEVGMTIVDFNKSYNPPCAFNEFATCPVASPQNRLKTKILAGERFDPTVHLPADRH